MGALVFTLGLIIGSFINVVALRYSGKGHIFAFKKLSGRSHCPYCRKKLEWYELIPLVSFFWQLGRCRKCRRKLSWQYPLVELASGFALLIPFYLEGFTGAIWVLAALVMILMAAIDWRLKIIPDQINLFLAGLGIILGLWRAESFLKHYAPLLSPFFLVDSPFAGRIFAAIAALLFFGLIISISRGKAMGMGDLKLAGALGLLLGWPDIVLALSFAFMLGAAVGLILLAAGKKGLKSSVPFGPFLAAGVFIHILFGYGIAKWYFSLNLPWM